MKNESTDSDNNVFTAFFDSYESRTYVEQKDGRSLLRWTVGDQISLFEGNTLNRPYKFDGETGDNSGTFSLVSSSFGSGNDLSCHYAVYPYASGTKISDGGVITATLPDKQSYASQSFGLGANTMVAVTQDKRDTFLKFKNAGGYLKLQLYGDDVTVKSITLTGNNNEKLAGKATITSGYSQEPTVVMAADATQSITLDCGEAGVKIGTTPQTATAFWIVVPPTTFERGFTITATGVNGETFTRTTSNKIEIARNVVKLMEALKANIEIFPNNQIWYTSKNGKIVEPYNTSGFQFKIVSNVYENGKGVITFEKDLTSIPEYAFYKTDLVSVTIPNSVTSIGNSAFGGCTSLSNVSISNSLTTIGNRVFGSCASLSSITIPNNVKGIGPGMFHTCTSLSNVTIPNSVTYIGYNAFNNTPLLEEVHVQSATPPSLGGNNFRGALYNGTIYVPQGSLSAYKAADGWKSFKNIVEE